MESKTGAHAEAISRNQDECTLADCRQRPPRRDYMASPSKSGVKQPASMKSGRSFCGADVVHEWSEVTRQIEITRPGLEPGKTEPKSVVLPITLPGYAGLYQSLRSRSPTSPSCWRIPLSEVTPK